MSVELEMVLRLLLAAALGAIIGFEREKAGKAAGLRTHVLICLGSALFTIASIYGFGPGAEPSRIASSGCGRSVKACQPIFTGDTPEFVICIVNMLDASKKALGPRPKSGDALPWLAGLHQVFRPRENKCVLLLGLVRVIGVCRYTF